MEMKKRGLSPVIATVLLISLAIILAVIVFLWARGFIDEQVQKEGEPIANACEKVSFEAEAFPEGNEDLVFITNQGNVPIYGLSVTLLGAFGDTTENELFESQNVVLQGETGEVILGAGISGSIDIGDELRIVPILLGEVDGVTKPFICDEEFSQEIEFEA